MGTGDFGWGKNRVNVGNWGFGRGKIGENIENRSFAWWKVMVNRENFWEPGFRVGGKYGILGGGTSILWLS